MSKACQSVRQPKQLKVDIAAKARRLGRSVAAKELVLAGNAKNASSGD